MKGGNAGSAAKSGKGEPAISPRAAAAAVVAPAVHTPPPGFSTAATASAGSVGSGAGGNFEGFLGELQREKVGDDDVLQRLWQAGLGSARALLAASPVGVKRLGVKAGPCVKIFRRLKEHKLPNEDVALRVSK